jgi:hypothetical protein
MRKQGRLSGSWSNKPPPLPVLSEAAETALEYMTLGDSPALANWKAADEYGLEVSDVAEETGRYASAIRERRKWFNSKKQSKGGIGQ